MDLDLEWQLRMAVSYWQEEELKVEQSSPFLMK